MKYFLVLYDRRTSAILNAQEYAAEQRAEALRDRELMIHERTRDPGQTELEVILFSADSFEDVKRTHARYFKTADELVRDAKTADELVREAETPEVVREADTAIKR